MKTTQHSDKRFGKLTTAVLDSGLTVKIMEKPLYTSAHVVFGTKYGSIDNCFSTDNENFITVPDGIAHFLEHKLFESEEKDAFSRFSETGAYANAYTSFDRTCYLFNSSSNFYDNLEILLDFVTTPYFTEETVRKEQGIIGQEIKMYEDSPGWRVLFNMLDKMFDKHPVKIDIAGTAESISKIDSKLLYDCYNTFYNMSNMCLCIAGNVDTEKTLDFISKNIKNTEKKVVYRNRVVETDSVSSQYVEQKLSVSGPVFCFGYKEIWDTPIRTQKDKIVADIMLEIVCGDCSRLYRELTDEKLINDEFSSEYFYGPDYSVIFFDGESKNPKEVARKIDAEIKRIISEGIDADFLEAVKKATIGEHIRKFEHLDSIVSDMIESAFYGDDILDAQNIIAEINETDIIERLKMLNSDRAVLSVINRKED